MYYVCLLKSINFPETIYVGYATNLKQRCATHNAGGSIHTVKYKPWELRMYLGFIDKIKAAKFEKYLKSQSGNIFIKKRLI